MLNSVHPFTSDNNDAQFKKGVEMAKYELLEQMKLIMNEFYYNELIRNAIDNRFSTHNSGRVIYVDANLYHLEASAMVRKVERNKKMKKVVMLIIIK